MSDFQTLSDDRVAVRSRWNGTDVAELPAEILWDFHFRNDPGGVCRALPRSFLFAHVWCDRIAGGVLGHLCREGPPPHDLLVCILPNDNPADVYERLRVLARR